MVEAWAKDYQATPDQSHLMLAFTNKDANKLNEAARYHMRAQGIIQGHDYKFTTQRIETDDFGKEQRTYHDRTFAQGDRLLFTRNDNSLKVKNGSLGTIVSIDPTKITVQLDKTGDKEGEAVAFAPNLYPFIDNGWATTIIKAQGVTVDHTKLLASFDQYRNLAYVGMSRHRHTLKIYASNLDFWREDKIIDRLSRVQEKLSGFDYLDTHKIQEKLEEDTNILWHQQKFQQGKDLWNAIKVTALDVFNKALDRSQEASELKEEFKSFDDSEEMRSRDFFEYEASHKAQETADKIAKQEQTRLLKQQAIDLKRQRFVEDRLYLNQEWCTNLGFFCQHKRHPENEAEMSAAYWQAERLTAIEGRLYGQALEKDKRAIPDDKLILKARGLLDISQTAPEYVMTFGRTSDLRGQQLKEFEQHVLLHQDKTNRIPEPGELDHICKAIKAHEQLMSREVGHVTINPPSMDENPNMYRALIEQQAILRHITNHNAKAWENMVYKAEGTPFQITNEQNATQMVKNVSSRESTAMPQLANEQDMSKAEYNRDMQLKKDNQELEIIKKDEKTTSLTFESLSLKRGDIKDACSDRLQKLDDRVRDLKEFNQRMADLELRRQMDRGRGMGM